MLILLLSGGVTTANTPPNVNAGSDIPATTLVDFLLDATVTDDGLIGPLTYQWTQQSGPGTVTFLSPTSVDTLANADLAGVYVLRLTADDGALTAFDELQVFVSDPAVGGSDEPGFFWR